MAHHHNASAWLTEVKAANTKDPNVTPVEVGRPGPSRDPVG